ncbi:phage holin [Oceanobacillus timonensis]|uniref:phage holin n=1 Tax=Oceanobacillus timonensis TaxID=1926285 RepID=UPI0009BC60F3|nr:phage holin [Oceanobacillus timonensis]
MDKGTLISIIAVMIAAANQVLVLLGKSPMLIDSTLIEQVVSAIFTIVTVLNAWLRRKKANMAKEKKKENKNKRKK